VELRAALRGRRMVRAFDPAPLDPALLDELLDWARRAPSAGNSQAVGFVVLDQPAATARYWDITLPPDRRSQFRWQGLLDAPALVLVTTRPDTYRARYAESDKQRTGLGRSTDNWPVPYWFVDAGAAAQNLLLLAVEAELGACLFGPFDHEPALARAFALKPGERIVATVALGRPRPDEPGRSARRVRPTVEELIRRPGSRE
jgi:nitroreductase